MKKFADSIYKLIYVVMAIVFIKLLWDILGRDFVPRTVAGSIGRVAEWIAGSAVLMLIYWSIRKAGKLWTNYGWVVLVLFSIVLFTAQMLLGNELRINPLYDYSAIYHGAIDWLVAGTFERFYDYYYYYPNNLGPMTFLLFWFQIASKFGCTDFYFVGMLVNSLLSVGMVVATYIVCKKLFSATEAVFSIVLYALYPPMYLIASIFYTDQLTMIFPVLIYLLYLCLDKCKSNTGTWIYAGIMAVVSVIGYFLKATAVFMLIAVVISLFLACKWKKLAMVMVTFFVVYLCFNLVFDNYIYGTHLDRDTADRMNTPVETWIMMGLNENPGFSPDDTEFSRSIEDPQKRKEVVRQEIMHRLKGFGIMGMAEHIKNKGIMVFSDGTFELSYSFLYGFQKETKLENTITLLGDNYNNYWDTCSAIWYVYLIFGVAFFVLVAVRRVRAKEVSPELLPIPLATFGLYCFLMMWEVHARYMVNFFSCFVLLAVGGMTMLWGQGREKDGR